MQTLSLAAPALQISIIFYVMNLLKAIFITLIHECKIHMMLFRNKMQLQDMQKSIRQSKMLSLSNPKPRILMFLMCWISWNQWWINDMLHPNYHPNFKLAHEGLGGAIFQMQNHVTFWSISLIFDRKTYKNIINQKSFVHISANSIQKIMKTIMKWAKISSKSDQPYAFFQTS